MVLNTDSALKVAEFLLQIKAVRLNPQDPFTWASGINSPIYCDNRKALSHSNIRTFIRQEFTTIIQEEFGTVDAIIGVATGGIAQGVLVAQELGIPFGYARSSVKQHGLQNMIEGDIQPEQSVVVIEDLVSTGKSSLNAVRELKNIGCKVKGMAAIFTYGFDVAKKSFEEENCPLVTLTDYDVLIEQALKSNYIAQEDLSSLKEWRENPQEWKP